MVGLINGSIGKASFPLLSNSTLSDSATRSTASRATDSVDESDSAAIGTFSTATVNS